MRGIGVILAANQPITKSHPPAVARGAESAKTTRGQRPGRVVEEFCNERGKIAETGDLEMMEAFACGIRFFGEARIEPFTIESQLRELHDPCERALSLGFILSRSSETREANQSREIAIELFDFITRLVAPRRIKSVVRLQQRLDPGEESGPMLIEPDWLMPITGPVVINPKREHPERTACRTRTRWPQA